MEGDLHFSKNRLCWAWDRETIEVEAESLEEALEKLFHGDCYIHEQTTRKYEPVSQEDYTNYCDSGFETNCPYNVTSEYKQQYPHEHPEWVTNYHPTEVFRIDDVDEEDCDGADSEILG